MKYLMATNEPDVQAALNRINLNCGFPNACGTQNWEPGVSKAWEQNIWYIAAPSINGYYSGCGGFTYEQMMNAVVNVQLSDGNPSWFPPEEE